MKYLLLGLIFLVSLSVQGQGSDSLSFETFEYTEGDTTFLMKKYFLCIYTTGSNRSHEEAEASEIMSGHLAHLSKLAEEGIICVAGPFDNAGDNRGLVIYSTFTKKQAEAYTAMDPAVKAGRLGFEIHPFWAAKGSKLF